MKGRAAAVVAGRISVHVTPRASANGVEAMPDGSLSLRVTAAPADGAANRAVVALLADALGIAPSRVEIVSGATARQKVVRVSDVTPDDLAARVTEIGAQASVARRRRTAGRIPPAR